jgi:predicted HAD superfamily Cof-like phosphohydrolase
MEDSMSKVFTDVSVFLSAVGQETPATPQKTVSDQAQLYKELIEEEVTEFWDAEAMGDDVEEIDACFDMIWVIVGYMKSRGLDCEVIWDEGAKSNLSKIDPVTGLVRKRADGKIMKPEGWQPPDFKKFA